MSFVSRYWSANENRCMQCREGWTPYVDSCYRFYQNANRNWEEADKFCKENNSTLLTLKDYSKFEEFQSIFKNDQAYNEISQLMVKSWVSALK
jgi:hypothetical protein